MCIMPCASKRDTATFLRDITATFLNDIPAWRHCNIPKRDGHIRTYMHMHIMKIDP